MEAGLYYAIRINLSVMLKSLRPLDLKTRVLLLVSFLIIVGIWGLATFVATVLQTNLEKMISQQLAVTLDYVTDGIDDEMKIRIAALNRLAASITPEVQSDLPRLQRLLRLLPPRRRPPA